MNFNTIQVFLTPGHHSTWWPSDALMWTSHLQNTFQCFQVFDRTSSDHKASDYFQSQVPILPFSVIQRGKLHDLVDLIKLNNRVWAHNSLIFWTLLELFTWNCSRCITSDLWLQDLVPLPWSSGRQHSDRSQATLRSHSLLTWPELKIMLSLFNVSQSDKQIGLPLARCV